jgi:hypothetical protein
MGQAGILLSPQQWWLPAGIITGPDQPAIAGEVKPALKATISKKLKPRRKFLPAFFMLIIMPGRPGHVKNNIVFCPIFG